LASFVSFQSSQLLSFLHPTIWILKKNHARDKTKLWK
jgi:hypothetical protein